jgi:5-methylcytosine-specific restriction endonuclease McrA
MAFSQDVKDAAYKHAGGKCECKRISCSHHIGRCNASLIYGKWEAHHITSKSAGGADTLSNCEALCGTCHKNTMSYGG